MRSLRPLAALILAFLTLSAHAQSLTQWIQWGDAATARGDHYGASRFYQQALEMEPGRMTLQWKYAEACRHSHQYDKAAAHYDKVQHKDMGRQYPQALRLLGEMRLCEGRYEEAVIVWQRVLNKEKNHGSVVAQRARNAIEGAAKAIVWVAAPADVQVEHLPEPVNSYDSEFGARLDAQGTLWFASLRGELKDDGEVVDTLAYRVALWSAARKEGAWGTPAKWQEPPPGMHEANVSWSSDGRFMYFTRCPSEGPCRIHVKAADEPGSRPLGGMPEDVMSTQPMVALHEGRERLFFTSDRAGGPGGLDLWWAELHGDRVGEAWPLNGTVNSPGNECAPFFDAVNTTLHFSSDHHPGMGGYDMFTSVLQDDVFQDPVNPGAPLNSPANDLYPSYDPATRSGLFNSNRVGSLARKGETCCSDIYRYQLPPEEVVAEEEPVVVDGTSTTVVSDPLQGLRSHLPMALYFHNDEPEPRTRQRTTRQDYPATLRNYRDQLAAYREANATDPDGLDRFETFFRNEVEKGAEDLERFIDQLAEVLSQGRSVELVVRGHASPLARNDYNRDLSARRIASLVNHLRRARGGTLGAYLDERAEGRTQLVITQAPFGEERAALGVSDDLRDTKRSVYSAEAARERRIEIEEVRPLGEQLGALRFSTTTIDLGPTPLGTVRQAEFRFRNTGSSPVRLLGVEADCGCTTAVLGDERILPGATSSILVEFNGRAREGPLMRRVELVTDGDPERIELFLVGTILPEP